MDGGVAGRATAFWWQGMARRALLGSADEVVLEAQKGLEAQSAMADVSLAAMAGVTAADHERICNLEILYALIVDLVVTVTYHQSAPPEDATSETS